MRDEALRMSKGEKAASKAALRQKRVILKARIADLEAAMYKAHGMLGALSMATHGHLRGRICTVYNILGEPLGRGRSTHGSPDNE